MMGAGTRNLRKSLKSSQRVGCSASIEVIALHKPANSKKQTTGRRNRSFANSCPRLGEGVCKKVQARWIYDLPIKFASAMLSDDGIYWAFVAPLPDGRTLWRRIRSVSLTKEPLARELPPAPRGFPWRHNRETQAMNKALKTSDTKLRKKLERTTAMTAVEHRPNAQPPTLSTNEPEVPAIYEISEADLAALAAEARDLNDDVRVGDVLSFKKGKWSQEFGDKENEITATMPFAADARSYQRGWIEWRDGIPVRKIIGRPIDGFISPRREQLGDIDERLWPCNSKGEPKDPFQENFFLVLRNLTNGRLCTWQTNTWYGKKAMGVLLNAYVRDGRKHPGCMPVVLLSSEERKTAKFGNVSAPVLRIVDWKPFGDGAALPGTPMPQPKLSPAQQLLLPSKAQTTTIGDEMDDDVPF
jgi:hypothetical protein